MQYATRWSLERPQLDRYLHRERSKQGHTLARRALMDYYGHYDRVQEGFESLESLESYYERVVFAHIDSFYHDDSAEQLAREYAASTFQGLERYDESTLLRDGHVVLLPLENLSQHAEYIFSIGQRAVWLADNAGRVLSSVKDIHGSFCTNGLGEDIETLDCQVSEQCPRKKVRSYLLQPLHQPDETTQLLGVYEEVALARLQAALAVDVTTIEDEEAFIETNLEGNR